MWTVDCIFLTESALKFCTLKDVLEGIPNMYDAGVLRELKVMLLVSVGMEKLLDFRGFGYNGFLVLKIELCSRLT